jgi:hypothetical protein
MLEGIAVTLTVKDGKILFQYIKCASLSFTSVSYTLISIIEVRQGSLVSHLTNKRSSQAVGITPIYIKLLKDKRCHY